MPGWSKGMAASREFTGTISDLVCGNRAKFCTSVSIHFNKLILQYGYFVAASNIDTNIRNPTR